MYSVNSMQLTLQMLNRRVYTGVQCKLNAADVKNVKLQGVQKCTV